ncbi:MAG TPA: purine-nucleoside phosphorylase [Chitinophagales bacterium]|nr:purine-nucleoside phosphorylase [Chitinophagales bacterium]
MNELLKQLNGATDFIRNQTSLIPEVAVVIGSGLTDLVKEVRLDAEIDYAAIPDFPQSTVEGHSGKLLLGVWNKKRVVVMSGRIHYYEGYTMQQVTFPIRVMKQLGANTILITNASGGLNPEIKAGDLMAVTDHINLISENPLRGKNNDELGPRFPDQHAIYDNTLIQKAGEIAERNQIKLHRGVYVGVPGPTFETPAEYKYMRLIGGDVVGMSTVPEVIVANHSGMRIFCLSVICDEGNPAIPVKISHEDVVRAAKDAEPRMELILKELLAHL